MSEAPLYWYQYSLEIGVQTRMFRVRIYCALDPSNSSLFLCISLPRSFSLCLSLSLSLSGSPHIAVAFKVEVVQ